MKCPFCGYYDTRVVDTRVVKNASIIRRRRMCDKCKHKFTTYERVEEVPLMVIKSDNRREPFDINKLREGILRAIEKRPVSSEDVERIISEVQQELAQKFTMEVPSSTIGKLVLKHLFELDPVAYVRFASVYYQYDSIEKFMKELRNLKRRYSSKRYKDNKNE
ncbi:MAG: transcriptional regulator NrdR [Endomicrobia bacterium]|nr:transcriptional regulator NrdR [Endomicrobiia bacterium]MCX7941290.1 transcriptional regulator NrdR [Endomicrobiia bacterium]MDW8055626.1 transcriptional regulator NrdR [Elusimicrobiota bacterium]